MECIANFYYWMYKYDVNSTKLFIPLPVNSTSIHLFAILKKTFTRFIWNNKHPQLHLSLLYLPYERGGLKVPNVKLYYWAAQLCSAMYYVQDMDPPAWIDIEKNGITIPLQMYLYSSSIKMLKKTTHNPFLRNTISVWYEAHNFFVIWGNTNFVPWRSDKGFKNWMFKGISQVDDLYDEGIMLSFQQLMRKYSSETFF